MNVQLDGERYDAWSLRSRAELAELTGGEIAQLLVIDSSDVSRDSAREVRLGQPVVGLTLTEGTWAFREPAGAWRAITVGSGNATGHARGTFQALLESPDPIWVAFLTLNAGWGAAQPLDASRPRFAPGSLVTLIGGNGEIGTVTSTARRIGDSWQYEVAFGRDRSRVLEKSLVAFESDNTDVASWLNDTAADARTMGQAITLVKLRQPLTDVLYSYGSTRTAFRSYQFKPLLKLLATGTERLLIADEVGLGKTIEAGLIWTELDQRAGIRRGLVVCPASLTRKWQGEMRRRFDRDLELIDQRRLGEIATALEEGRDPVFHGICSIESLRTSPHLDSLSQFAPRIDLVIVDEAHALRNTGTRSFSLGELLSDWADVLLFLSATPLNLGRDDLFNLLNLLSPDEFPDRRIFDGQIAPNTAINDALGRLRRPNVRASDVATALRQVGRSSVGRLVVSRPEYQQVSTLLQSSEELSAAQRSEASRLLVQVNTLSSVVTRTRKVEVPDAKATRVARQIDVNWTPEEARLYEAVRTWARERALANGGVVGFATVMPLRQAASCLPASKEILESRHPELATDDDDLDDLDGLDADDEFADINSAQELLRDALNGLGAVDTKFDAFEQTLRTLQQEGIRQVMVFSFFRRTLSYLQRRLAMNFRTRVMDGSITSMDERARIMSDFRAGKFDILLVSEVGSEGLDFEFCGALINYDLPWNPMRVEQRIGRLDRFGQQFERIHIFNFHVPGTIETEIFERLYQRIRVFEESIGELEPIIRDDLAEVTRLAVDPKRSDEERSLEVDRIGVALENRRAELADISSAASTFLAGFDNVLIDGLEQDTLAAGKYVGESEIEDLVDSFVTAYGGRLKRPVKGGRLHELIGTPELAQRAQRALEGNKQWSIDPWLSSLRDGQPIPVTFSAERAMESSAVFLNLGHPLVRAAGIHMADHHELKARVGYVRIASSDTGPFVTLLSLVTVNGIRPQVELRTPTINLATGERADHVGSQLLAAHARGELRDAPPIMGIQRHHAVELERAMEDSREEIEIRYRSLNDAMIEGRRLTLQRTYASKIQRAESTLAAVRRDGRAESIQRLHRGRIANLQNTLGIELDRLEEARAFAVTWRPIALIGVACDGAS